MLKIHLTLTCSPFEQSMFDLQMVTLLIQLIDQVSNKTFEENFSNPNVSVKNIIRYENHWIG